MLVRQENRLKFGRRDIKKQTVLLAKGVMTFFSFCRGVDEIGLNFQLPTCPRLFNIFHPFDPVVSINLYLNDILLYCFSLF